MKTQFVDLIPESPYFHYGLNNLDVSFPFLKFAARPSGLLTQEAMGQIALGSIPDLEQVCRDLFDTFGFESPPYSALQFIPVLKTLESIPKVEAERFFQNPKTGHVLVKNDLLKVVLIRWEPGQSIDVHGHPKGGCVFKILQGSLEEKRYCPDGSGELLSISTLRAGSMAYIDDDIALHAVSNPFDVPAISLHVYTPGA
ncbi:MAG: cysteine dioxygenase family protein [Saprospirales bacterium]|nr:cysteine dioxygenase family protein [Saprospirales bacterium]MBK8490390.1 cysteine dioxygenase family protein [Saprospirales bacterium]